MAAETAAGHLAVVWPVTGWHPYTHLVALTDKHPQAHHYLQPLALAPAMRTIMSVTDVRPGMTARDRRRTMIVGNESFRSGTLHGPHFRVTRIIPGSTYRDAKTESARLPLGMTPFEDVRAG